MKKVTKKNKKNNNIIFLVVMSIILLGLIFLSFYIKPKNGRTKELFTFNIGEFKNISPIDFEMFKASLNSNDTSIIFFCIYESGQCYNEVNYLNSIAEKYKLNIEYMDILELTDVEKTELQEKSGIFADENFFPNLLIIKEHKIYDNNNSYLNQDEIIDFFKKNNII